MRERELGGAAVALDAYIVHVGEQAGRLAASVAEKLRDAGLAIAVNAGGGSIKSQMKRADRSGAHFALILGDDELARGVVAIKELRGEGAQREVPLDGVAAELGRRLGVVPESR